MTDLRQSFAAPAKRMRKSVIAVLIAASALVAVPGAAQAEIVPPADQSFLVKDFKYHYEYDIQNINSPHYTNEKSAYGAAATMVTGVGGAPQTFPVGVTCKTPGGRTTTALPEVGGTCDIFSAGKVKVVERTPNSWTYEAMPGHVEGAGRRIKFEFFRGYNGFAYFSVRSWGPWTVSAYFTVHSNFAKVLWQSYATNLKNAMIRGVLPPAIND